MVHIDKGWVVQLAATDRRLLFAKVVVIAAVLVLRLT